MTENKKVCSDKSPEAQIRELKIRCWYYKCFIKAIVIILVTVSVVYGIYKVNYDFHYDGRSYMGFIENGTYYTIRQRKIHMNGPRNTADRSLEKRKLKKYLFLSMQDMEEARSIWLKEDWKSEKQISMIHMVMRLIIYTIFLIKEKKFWHHTTMDIISLIQITSTLYFRQACTRADRARHTAIA